MRISDWSSDVCSSDLTAFEFVTDRLGAQGTVLGGGRYDGLIEALGGPPTAAVGWAAGIERLAMLLDFQSKDDAIAVVADHPSRLDEASQIAKRLRANGKTVISIFKGRSEERRVGKECVSTCRSGGSRDH